MKYLKFLILLCAPFICISCETDIPDTDTTPPKFTFNIQGDGFEHLFDHNSNYDGLQLNLKHGASYNFIYTGTDNGGVKLIQWQAPTSEYIEFAAPTPSPWQDYITGISRVIRWNGDPNNPLTGNILAGEFEANGDSIIHSFRFYVSDFGGETGDSNFISKELVINIGNHDTEIIEF